MAYERVNWENLPSTNTPVNADNLNKLNDAIDAKINTSDIVDNLTSTNTDKPLSANQGKVINEKNMRWTASIASGTGYIKLMSINFKSSNNAVACTLSANILRAGNGSSIFSFRVASGSSNASVGILKWLANTGFDTSAFIIEIVNNTANLYYHRTNSSIGLSMQVLNIEKLNNDVDIKYYTSESPISNVTGTIVS